jgi:hypothetical protein
MLSSIHHVVRRTKSQPFQLIIRRTGKKKHGPVTSDCIAFPLLTTHQPDQRHVSLEEHVKACARSCRRPDWARFVAVVRVPHLAPVQCECATATASGQPNRCRSSAQSRGPLASGRPAPSQNLPCLRASPMARPSPHPPQTMTSPKPERIHPLQTPRHRLPIPSGTQPIQRSARGRLCCVSGRGRSRSRL